MELSTPLKGLIKIGLIFCVIELVFIGEMVVYAKKKESKNKCGIKVVAIERIKYKLVPVEVPRHNYLPDKQLTNKELKKAWKTFAYSGIKNPSNDDGEQSDPDAGVSVVTNAYGPVAPIGAVHANPQQPPANVNQPQVIYVRKDTLADLDSVDSVKDLISNRDSGFYSYRDNHRDSSIMSKLYPMPKLKRRSGSRRRVSKKVFYDYD